MSIVLVVFLVVLPTLSVAAESYWNTTIGLMIVDRQESNVVGTYEGVSEGIFIGTVQPDGTIDAVWFDSSEVDRCTVDEAGSKNWGKLRLVPDEDQFIAYRSFCDQPLPSEVNLWGVLVSGWPWVVPDWYRYEPPLRSELDMDEDSAIESVRNSHDVDVTSPDVHAIEIDLTCDGGKDRVYAWLDVENSETSKLFVSTSYFEPLPQHEEPTPTSRSIEIPLGPTGSLATCEDEPSISSFQLSASDATSMELERRPSCKKVLVISDACGDSLKIYWSTRHSILLPERRLAP